MRRPVDIPPGMHRKATTQATGQAWFDMSQVRFNGRVMQPIGGWFSLPGMQLNDAVRNIQAWRDITSRRWIAASTLGQIMLWDGAAGYDLTPAGFVAGSPADLVEGYGIGLFGVGLYGTPRIPSTAFDPLGSPGDTVSLDNWGENLVVCGSADGRILWWVPETGPTSPLVPIPPATPTETEAEAGITHTVPPARYVFVTDERFVVALGASEDGRQVAWSDQERPGAWTPWITNLAGSLELQTTGMARSGTRSPFGNIIFCDDDVHLMSFVGPPYAYGIRRVGTGCSAIGPMAFVSSNTFVGWMGQETFWQFNGAPAPLPCEVQEFVFGNINRNTQGRTVACQNGLFPEAWWFYPDQSSVDPNRYVAWNWADNIWIAGALPRTGCSEPKAYGLPMFGDVDGFVYAHESGWLADGTQRGPSDVWASTGDLMLGNGDQLTCIRSIIPDFGNAEQAQIHLLGQLSPEDELIDFGVFPLTRPDGIIDALLEARTIQLRIEGVTQPTDGQVAPWTLGRIAFDVVPGSER